MRTRLFILFCAAFFAGCGSREDKTIQLSGEAQGTTYHITYTRSEQKDLKKEIDSLLKAIDLSLSTYVPNSIISRFNRNDTSATADSFFKRVFSRSQEVSEETGGVFDITVAPVINAWGFGFTKKAEVDSAMIDSLLRFVGYEKVRLQDGKIIKADPAIMLDFNAIAQGYTVDVLSWVLEGRGIVNYLVELGGEVRTKGSKANGDDWKIGIDQPDENHPEGRPLKAVVRLKNSALATSGNYRKYYVQDGRKYAHIIDPATGYPAKHSLLSATVIADDCMTADAFATVFMVMGMEKAKKFLLENPGHGLSVFFIYDENGSWKTYMSEELKGLVEVFP